MGRDGVTPGRRGRFPGFDVLAEAGHWDPVTRALVLARVHQVPDAAFFDAAEEATARALCDRLLAQDDEPRVPVVEMIDARLLRHEADGYRHEDMPDDGAAWKRSLAGLDEDARVGGAPSFPALPVVEQRDTIEGVRSRVDDWHGMPASRVFGLWMRYATTAFYSHPWAWNEIGFPGPAYPRGYKALTLGRREPFEAPERDSRDPIPWMHKVEAAHRRHSGGAPGGSGHRAG